MSFVAEDLSPARIVVEAILDIAAIASQKHRDDCLTVSGAQNMAELSNRLENSIKLLFQRGGTKQRPKDVPNCCLLDHPRICSSVLVGHPPYLLGHEKKELISGDFSSADEDDMSHLARTLLPAQRMVPDFCHRRGTLRMSCEKRELFVCSSKGQHVSCDFNRISASLHVDDPGFSSASDSPPSSICVDDFSGRQLCVVANEDDFSQDENESPSLQMVPLIEGLSTGFGNSQDLVWNTNNMILKNEGAEDSELSEFSE